MSDRASESPTIDELSLEKLVDAWRAFTAETSPSYDEVLNVVAGRIVDAGSVGKEDIGALLFWKRLRADTRWARDLMLWPDSEVRRVTSSAVEAANNNSLSVPEAARAARSALSPLPGFQSGDALASAMLFAAAPRRLAVYDRRADKGLKTLGLQLSSRSGRYGRYMAMVETLRAAGSRHGCTWLARDVDLALYHLGG